MNADMDRWRLLEPPLEASGLDKPTRQLSDDDDMLLVEESEEIVKDSSEMVNPSGEMVSSTHDLNSSRHSSVSMTGVINIVNGPEEEPSEAEEMWSGEIKWADDKNSYLDDAVRPLPGVDRLAVSERSSSAQSFTSNRTSKSVDVALKVPIRVVSEADEMEDSVCD
ncbi:MAG: hypothetical protein SGBAC_008722 [Bacillariaceae sp.]